MSEAAGANAKLRIGEIEIIGITDFMAPFPFTVDRVFPTVTAEEWILSVTAIPTPSALPLP